jgi:hypothetical protein
MPWEIPCPLSFGTQLISPIVYGCWGSLKISEVGPDSTMLPAYMMYTRSVISRTTPREWVTRTTDSPLSRTKSPISLRIWSWMVTSREVPGSSARRS